MTNHREEVAEHVWLGDGAVNVRDDNLIRSDDEDDIISDSLAYLVSVMPEVNATKAPASSLKSCGHAELDLIMPRL